jgi:dienelactone hydrolase
MNINKDLPTFWQNEPPGQRTNAIRWLQKKVIQQSSKLPRDFKTTAEWEHFRTWVRQELPEIIGIPRFPPLQPSTVRARISVGRDVLVERVDVYVDEDYAIPVFVFLPVTPPPKPMPGLVWNPGWPQDKWDHAYETFAVRMAKQGFVVLILDHAPFGETTPYMPDEKFRTGMTHVMGAGHLLGISQLALRSAETSRCGEYLRSRPDVDQKRVALAGLCQGGQDTWLTAALDDGFCAAAPFCSETTFTTHIAEMGSYFANADSSPFPFGILKICDVDHLHAMIAPRPLLVRSNLPDQWWPISGFDDVESLTRKIYRLYSAENRVDFRAEIHEHNLTGPFADALEAFLLKYLANQLSW